MSTSGDGTFRALPRIDDDVFGFVLRSEGSLLSEYGGIADDLSRAFAQVDEDLDGLRAANPNLSALTQGTVEGLFAVFAESLGSEHNRALFRVLTFFNAFVLLRALDMQLRKGEDRTTPDPAA